MFLRFTKRGVFNFVKRSTFCTSFLTSVMETDAKRKAVRIGTHNGTFHCDDVLACVLLKLLPENKDAQIIRSRDETVLRECDFVVDVGAIYDHTLHRYDHHQSTFDVTMKDIYTKKNFSIKLSSAGLVYAHYGHSILQKILSIADEEQTNAIFDKVYENFIQEIDAIDNGVSICDGEPRYHINTHISARVKKFLPNWNEPSSPEILFDRFEKAMDMVESEFKESAKFYGNVWWSAKSTVENAVKSRYEVDQSGTIIELPCGLPWKEHLFSIEKQLGIENEIKFVIFPDGAWRVQGVPPTPDSFRLRIPLHSKWRGLRDQALTLCSGIEGCVFVHSSGFIGGNLTKEGCLEMARKSMIMECENGQ